MSVADVARKDLTDVGRSRGAWAAVTALALLAALIGYGFRGFRLGPRDQVLTVLRMLVVPLGILLPITVLVASYLAIAGERQSGGIKFLLGVPNTRRDVFFGKLLSRLGLVFGGIGFVFATGAAVVYATHGTLPIAPALGLFAATLGYAAVFVAVAVAVSAAVAGRGRGIAFSVGAYFLFVLFYAVPGLGIRGIVSYLHQNVLGAAADPNLYDAVVYTSPYTAFRQAANLALPAAYELQVFRPPPEGETLPWYLGTELSVAILAVWFVVPLAIGYWRFDNADLE